MSNLDKIAKKLQIEDLAKVDTQQANKILDEVQNGNIGKADYEELLLIVPNLTNLSIKYLESAVEFARNAANSQKAAIEAISNVIEGLKILASNAESDVTREKIAEKFISASKIIADISKDNNHMWQKALFGGAVVILAFGVITGRISLADAGKVTKSLM